MPLTISKISFLAIIANSLKLTLTNLYFFKMIPNSRFFLLLPQLAAFLLTLPLPLGGSGGTSTFIEVAIGSTWAASSA